ncbi:exonuclease domain-containing protein [Mycobacterium sp. DL440]|uniref:exonuclease domain-containing protein n=1 Tax=Mycobacterium sp. DL440 TaxID=2675523 RepID=UPI00141F6C66|nr:exonuclease domain-containing protein [Mycobacterium sp. DL440]
MLAIDTETTGLSLDRSRIVSVGIITPDDTEHPWLLKTVDHIPPESTEVHRITDEKLARDGVDPATGFGQIAEMLHTSIAQRDLIVAFNARMDLTWLYREFDRYGLTQPDWAAACVVDPLVIHLIGNRTQTSRSLAALSEEYKLAGFDAHNAIADARRAREIAYAVGSRFPDHARPHPLHITAHQRSRRKDLLRAAAKSGQLRFNPDEPWPIVDIHDPAPVPATTVGAGGRRGGRWDDTELDQLQSEVEAGLEWSSIGARHQRTPLAVWSKARNAGFVPYLAGPPQ